MFTELFEAVPDALVLVDPQGLIVRANGRALALFGYARGTLVGESIELLVPEEARSRHRAHRAGYMAQPHVRAMGATGQTLTGRRRDGSGFPLEIALSPLQGDGPLHYLASIRDVSESPRVRQMLVRSRYDALVARFGQLALQSREEENVLAHVPGLLAEGLGIESVLIALVGEDGGDMESRASTGLGYGPQDRPHVDQERLLAALRKGSTWEVVDFSEPCAADTGFPLVHAATGSAVLAPLLDLGRPMGALLVHSREPRKFDHDALHLLESFANLVAALVQRQRTLDQLAHVQRLDALGQLTGGIAHDFNNLLTIMSGNLQLLGSEPVGTDEARELIDSALRSVTRGAELTGKLLSFARRQQLVPQAVELKALLHDLNQMLRRTLGDTIRLRIDCPDGLPCAHADPAQLDTALLNLSLNARDAMPHGGEISVKVRSIPGGTRRPPGVAPGPCLLITVADTGRGMAPSTLARAMDPFFTTKEAGRGSGLGLSMVHGFARQSGGDLWIDSTLGYGTRVHLCLPVAAGQTGTTTATGATGDAPRQRTPGSGQTVLVVDDQAPVRRVAVAFLRKAGYRVVEAASAAGAMRALDADPGIALLLTDVLLGDGGNGNQLAAAARRLRPGLPILLISGFEQASSPHWQASGGAPAYDLLRKPYRREQLLEAVQAVLGGKAPGLGRG